MSMTSMEDTVANNFFMSTGLDVDLGDDPVVSLAPVVTINNVICQFESFDSSSNLLKLRTQNTNPWSLFEANELKANISSSSFQYTIEWTSYNYLIEYAGNDFVVTIGDKQNE